MRRFSFLLLLVVLIPFFPPEKVHACSCMATPAKERTEAAHMIFEGKAIAEEVFHMQVRRGCVLEEKVFILGGESMERPTNEWNRHPGRIE